MAKIIGLKEKQLALKQIEQKIRTLGPINEFLAADNPSGIYTVSFGAFKSPLLCPDQVAIRKLVSDYKSKLVREIRAQAEQYSIEFEEDEETLLK